ncbi:PPOX class F420-dependent oxidoreductase [Spirillospora sp. CA-255316]
MTYGPGQGPGPLPLSDDALTGLLAEHRMGVLGTNKRDGIPHLSTVAYHWDPERRVARISTTAGRAKVRQLRRDPRAALHVTSADFMAFVVAQGEAELSAVSEVPGDEAGRELLALQPPYERAEDEKAFLEQMVLDRRLVIRVRVSRLYGTALDIPRQAENVP